MLDNRLHLQHEITTLVTGQRTPGWKGGACRLNRAIDILCGCEPDLACGPAVGGVHVTLHAPRALLEHPLADDDRVPRNDRGVRTSETHADPPIQMEARPTLIPFQM